VPISKAAAIMTDFISHPPVDSRRLNTGGAL
jgi:hypothetical protein